MAKEKFHTAPAMPIKPLPVKTEKAPEVKPLTRPEITIKGKDLKPCPKCGDVSTGPYYDKHGHVRCNCSHPKCNYWDSVVYANEKAAAAGWESTVGPDKSNW